MDRLDFKEMDRIKKQREKEGARKKRYEHTMTTRKDVMGIIDLYNQHKIIPLAASRRDGEGRRIHGSAAVAVALATVEEVRGWRPMARTAGDPCVHCGRCGHEIRGHFTHCRRRER